MLRVAYDFLKLTIRKKLFLSFIFVSLASIILSTYLNFKTTDDSVRQQLLSNLTLVAEAKEGHLYEFLERLRGRVVDFASDGYIRDSAASIESQDQAYNPNDLNIHLKKNKMSLDESISGINIFDLNGSVIASTDDFEIGRNDSDEDYFVGARRLEYGQTYLSDVKMSDHFNMSEPIFSVSAPLMNRDTFERLGVLVIYIKTDELNDLMSGKRQLDLGALTGLVGRGESFDTYIVNSSGYMISASRYGGQSTVLKQKVTSLPYSSCVTRHEGSSSYVNYRNKQVIGSWMCFDNGWTLIVEIDSKEALSVLEKIKLDGLVTMLVLFIFIFIFSLITSRKFSDPIKKLSQMAKKIGEGDLTQQISLAGTDELSQLADSINIMTHKLKQLYADQKKDTLEIAHEQAQDEAILKSIGDGLVVLDKHETILMVNTAFEQLLGWKAKEVIGKKVSDVIIKEDSDHNQIELHERFFYKTLKYEKQYSTKSISKAHYYVRKNKTRFPVATTATPIKLKGDSVGVVEVIRDITKEKNIDKAKTEFVSLTSHQLRTPLSKIRWYVELFRKSEKNLSKTQGEFLYGIDKANKYMIDLVNILLNVSRLEMGTLTVEREPTIISKLIEDVLVELSSQITSKQIKILNNSSSDSSPVMLDPKLMHIILINIIANAVKYSPESGVINIRERRENANVIIEVEDGGCGIPVTEQSRIFSKHFRAENAMAMTSEGSGLGLYIVKMILVKMHGTISFKSPLKDTRGTIFTIKIPTNNHI